MVVEPGSSAIVVEYLKGELTIFDARLGVTTNAPTYVWHEINLRNYSTCLMWPCRRRSETLQVEPAACPAQARIPNEQFGRDA